MWTFGLSKYGWLYVLTLDSTFYIQAQQDASQ